MKRLTAALLLVFVLVIIILPAFIVRGCDFRSSSSFSKKNMPATKEKKNKKEIVQEIKPLVISIYRADLKQIVKMDLEDYVKGVVAAEMPVKFDLEALKTQAVAARTFALKRTALGKKPLSTDFNVAQDWNSTQQLKEKWGEENYRPYWQKISQAVDETRGQVLTYHGQLIDAYYHSTCGGKTEDGSEVFNKDLPYLKPIKCYFDTHSLRYKEEKTITIDEVKRLLGIARDKSLNLKVVDRTKGNRVRTIMVAGKPMEALAFRRALGLRSTRFTWQVDDTWITFTTIGNGHGVGLCQYGADGLAKLGKKYQEILKYYYSGVDIIAYNKLK